MRNRSKLKAFRTITRSSWLSSNWALETKTNRVHVAVNWTSHLELTRCGWLFWKYLQRINIDTWTDPTYQQLNLLETWQHWTASDLYFVWQAMTRREVHPTWKQNIRKSSWFWAVADFSRIAPTKDAHLVVETAQAKKYTDVFRYISLF